MSSLRLWLAAIGCMIILAPIAIKLDFGAIEGLIQGAGIAFLAFGVAIES